MRLYYESPSLFCHGSRHVGGSTCEASGSSGTVYCMCLVTYSYLPSHLARPELRHPLIDRGLWPASCNHQVKLMENALNLSVEWEMCDVNPVKCVPLDNLAQRFFLNKLAAVMKSPFLEAATPSSKSPAQTAVTSVNINAVSSFFITCTF